MKLTMQGNKPSSLLTLEENETIFSLLGFKCLTLATTVVELYTTGHKDSDKWIFKDLGVLCLVKDNLKRSYFFRMFCPVKKQMIWEHEVYNHMNYMALSSYLHAFEAEDCIAGFNFADEEEGAYLRSALLEKLEKTQKRLEKKSRSYNHHNNNNNNNVTSQRVVRGPEVVSSYSTSYQSPTNKSRSTTKKRLTKADIGTPHDFVHISHVGWDPNKGFDIAKVDEPQLKEFFTQAGVSEMDLRDDETRDFIYDFIERHGGMEAIATALEPAPPVPTRARAPPPPPTRAPPATPPPPPPPLRTFPPRNLPASPKAFQEQVDSKPPPPPPFPGPPPPPPIPGPLAPPAPPTSAPPSDDPRSALMEAIRSQPQLNKVANVPAEPKKTPDSWGELMAEIRQGKGLTPVDTVQKNNVEPTVMPGLAGALAKALRDRSVFIHGNSDDEDEEEEEDENDEWDD